MSQSLVFRSDTPAGAILREWHKELQADRGPRARLRRARSPGEVIFEPAYHKLLHRLEALEGMPPVRRRELAAVAGLAAQVEMPVEPGSGESGEGPTLARQMAVPRGNRPAVSQQRFRRLLEIEGDLDRLYLYLGRIVQLLGRKADLFSLADGVYRWDRNPTIRQQWAYDYYGAAPSQPAERRAS